MHQRSPQIATCRKPSKSKQFRPHFRHQNIVRPTVLSSHDIFAAETRPRWILPCLPRILFRSWKVLQYHQVLIIFLPPAEEGRPTLILNSKTFIKFNI